MNNLEKLMKMKCFVLDMDGTFYLDDHLLPGAKELLALFDELDIPFLFLTNNSSRHKKQYADKLARLGISLSEDKIFTSGEASALYLKIHAPDAKLFIAGTPSLKEEFRQHGLCIDQENPDYVVLGFDTTVNYEILWKLCNYVKAGLPYLATHPDINCPVENGFMPDIGALIAFVETSTERRPDIIIGKPNLPIVEALSKRVNLPVNQLAMVGDRLYTDIALGKHGMITFLVLSGETHTEDLATSPFKPDYVLENLADLVEMLKKTRK